jgi:hypothetical protein
MWIAQTVSIRVAVSRHHAAPATMGTQSQRDRRDEIQRAENRCRDPNERDQMYDRQHPRVVEKPGDAARIDRDRRKGERERDVRDAKIEDGQEPRRQAVVKR